jgi:5'-deoxynucleotidase YfbR-like HD superfamily hydrolase
MSIWNRIGDVASTAKKNAFSFAGDLAGSVSGTARFAWDVGTAPWNDAEEYNGFIQPFKTAASKDGGDIIKPLASAGGAIMKVPGVQPALERINKINQEYIREPLTTFELVQGDVVKSDSLKTFFDPNEWRKAYKGAQDISYGQAVASKIRSIYDPKFNVYDPAQREKAFKDSAWGKFASGGLDLGVQFFGDVSLAAGKGLKVLKASELGVGKLTNADVVAKAAQDITEAQYGVNNRFSKVIDDFTKNDSVYAISHPMVKSSNTPGLLAHLLGDSVDRDETALILRSALGDPAAMDELRLQRAYITDALETARGKISAVDEFKLFSAPDGSGMLPFLNDNAAVTEEALANYRSLAANDKYFADLMQVGGAKVDDAGNLIQSGGSLTRTTGKALQGVENFVAQSRALKFYDKAVGSAKVEVFQPTPFHKLYQKISWGLGERPAGLVDFNDPDSYKEVIANISTLEKVIGLTPEQSKNILDGYISASTPEARYVATLNLEGKAIRSIAAKYGIDEDIANKIYNNYNGARTSALKSVKDKGFMVDTDGSIIKVPQLESQTANYLPLMDFNLMDNLLKRNSSALNSLKGITVDTTLHYVDILQDAFKAGALLRLGYTQRNAIDSQLRIAASVGSFATLRHLGPGLKNILNNTVAVPARLVDRYAPIDSGKTLKQVQQSSTTVVKELEILKKTISEAETKLSLNPENLDLAGKVNTFKELQKEKLAVYNHYSEVLNRVKSSDPKARIGTGSFKVTTSDGQQYDLYDAFGGPLGDMFRKIASSGNSFERMVDSNTDMYMRKLTSKGIGQVKPTDPKYFDQWAQTLRTQFGNSAVVKKIVAGESVDDISRWLRNSPDGRDLRRRLAIPSDEAADYITKVNGFLDQYLPASSNLRSKLVDITANDLRSTFKDPTELPIIHGHILEENLFNTSRIKGREIINTLFNFLGTLPEDTWARNPLYVHFYRQEAKRRVDIVAGLKGDKLSFADQQEIMGAAHKIALREMKGVLFNIERKSNLASAMKYISPFFSAQENAYKTWFKMAVANPQIVNRGYLVWNSPNKAGLVTDQDGKEVPSGQTSGNDTIWLGLPKGLTKIPGLQSLTEVGIPKGSLDILFQGGMDVLYMKGNPNVFSDVFPIGPYVAVPVSEIVKRQPSLEDSFKWALPFGPTKSAISGFLPSWFQKLQTKSAGLEDPAFARSYQLIWSTEQQKAKRNGLSAVNPDKIMKMTQDYWSMRTAANLIMPFAPRFDSPYKFYLDKSREYKRVYGLDADAKFLQDFPEFFSFSASLSSNPTGVQSSVQATNNINKYSGLVGELAKIEPKLVGLIVNNPSGYEFSQAAYNYLYNKRVASDSPQKFLSSQSPAEAQRKNEAEKGWIIYNQFSDDIDNELQKRNLSSVQQKGAEDLKYYKEQIIQKLSVQTDNEGKPIADPKTGQFVQTAWYNDYLDSDGSKTNRVIVGLGTILNDEKFVKDNRNNTTWKSVSTYLDFRKAIATELAKRDVKSIEAKANADLKYYYDAIVSKLKNDDKLGFSYLYERFLSQDLVYDKYLTPKEVK